MNETTVENPGTVKVAWRCFKERLKLTWLGWFYLCARRTLGGYLLLIFLGLCLMASLPGFFGYIAIKPYASWEDLPCQTGSLVKINSEHRGLPTGFLVDDAGNEHKFYSFGSKGQEVERRKSFYGQSVSVCFVHDWYILPPFYKREAKRIFFPDGTQVQPFHATPADARASSLNWLEVSLLWFGLPSLLWLLKRHGREAWWARRSYLNNLSNPIQSNSESHYP